MLSAAIEERVSWLLEQGINPTAVWGVSFTRTPALDLRQWVHAYCPGRDLAMATQVRVTQKSLGLAQVVWTPVARPQPPARAPWKRDRPQFLASPGHGLDVEPGPAATTVVPTATGLKWTHKSSRSVTQGAAASGNAARPGVP